MATLEETVEVAPVVAGEEGVMRIGRRCYVSNLAWRTSECLAARAGPGVHQRARGAVPRVAAVLPASRAHPAAPQAGRI